MELRIADYRRILSLVTDLGNADTLGSFMETGVAGLHRLAPSEAISFSEISFRRRPDGRSTDPRIRSYHEKPYVDWGDSFEAAQACRDEYPLCVGHDGQAFVKKISDVAPKSALQRLDVYQESMRPYGREYEFKVALPSPAGVCRAFIGTRPKGDYSDRDMSRLTAIHPHFIQAFASIRVRTRVAHALAALGKAEGLPGIAVLFLGTDDRIETTVGPALELLRAYVGLENGHLSPPVLAWLAAQRRLTLEPQVGSPPQPLTVDSADRGLTIRFLRGMGGDHLVLQERISRPTDPEESLSLTAREVEVLRLVGNGLTNKEAARKLGIRPNTVRKHLENAYVKLGVGTRTAAVARAFPRD